MDLIPIPLIIIKEGKKLCAGVNFMVKIFVQAQINVQGEKKVVKK